MYYHSATLHGDLQQRVLLDATSHINGKLILEIKLKLNSQNQVDKGTLTRVRSPAVAETGDTILRVTHRGAPFWIFKSGLGAPCWSVWKDSLPDTFEDMTRKSHQSCVPLLLLFGSPGVSAHSWLDGELQPLAIRSRSEKQPGGSSTRPSCLCT